MTPRIVAIAGGSASGKSTLSRALATALGDRVSVLLHDRYYRTVPIDQVEHWNYDHPDALDTGLLVQHLDRLRQGHAVDAPRYSFSGHCRVGTDRIEARPVVLVEGILVLASADVRARADLSLYVDAPPDIRLARRVLRDVVERDRQAEQVIHRYLASVRPMHEAFVEPSRTWADHIVDGTRSLDLLLPEVLGLVAPNG